MKTFIKWAGITVVALGAIAFMAFLYFISPFDFIPPEDRTVTVLRDLFH